MFDRVLAQPEKVRTRHRVRVLSVADRVGLLDDARPGACCGASDDGAVGAVGGDDLELGPVAAVEDCAVVDDFCCGVEGGEVSPDVGTEYKTVGGEVGKAGDEKDWIKKKICRKRTL